MYVCMHVYSYLLTRARTYGLFSLCMVCIYILVYACMYVCMYVCIVCMYGQCYLSCEGWVSRISFIIFTTDFRTLIPSSYNRSCTPSRYSADRSGYPLLDILKQIPITLMKNLCMYVCMESVRICVWKCMYVI